MAGMKVFPALKILEKCFQHSKDWKSASNTQNTGIIQATRKKKKYSRPRLSQIEKRREGSVRDW